MFQVSRSLYRRLAPLVAGDEPEVVERNRLHVLDCCEWTVRRLVDEPDFARPSRFLFEEIRARIPLSEQGSARRLIDYHVDVAKQLVARLPRERVCLAYTRQGAPCEREPVEGSDYCPSHRHLELVTEAHAA